MSQVGSYDGQRAALGIVYFASDFESTAGKIVVLVALVHDWFWLRRMRRRMMVIKEEEKAS